MNKEKLKKQNNLLIYLGIFIAVALILASILRILTPEEEQVVESDFVNKNYNKTQTTYKKVFFNGNLIEIPEKFSLFRPLSNENQAEELALKIINKYQLNERPDINNFWGNEEYYLTFQERNDSYSFYDYREIEKEESTSATYNTELFTKNCEDFFKDFGLNLLAKKQDKDIIFISEIEGGIDSFEKADLIEIPFTQEINDYPVFYQNERAYPFYCRVNKSGEVKSFIFKNLFQKFEEVKQLDSISLDKAINNISKGKASIISAQSQVAEILDLTYIQRADLESVEIDYRYDNELKILYPFYHFQADIINVDGLNIKAEIITPAVNSAQEQ